MQPRVNFTNVLYAAFTCTDPKIANKTDGLTVFFVLLGSVCVKDSRKILVKLNLGVGVNYYPFKVKERQLEIKENRS